jgi:type I restriction enzyme, S subunit
MGALTMTERKRLGEYAKLVGGYAFKSSDSQEKGIKWLKIANVGVGKIKWDTLAFLPVNYLDIYGFYVLKEDEIVVAMTRPILSNKLKIARLTKSDTPCLLNQRVGKLVINKNACMDYIYHYLQFYPFVKEMQLLISGTDPPNISSELFERIKVNFPPLPEQEGIARVLGCWDRGIDVLGRLITAKKKQKKALMQQLLTGKRRFKEFQGQQWNFVKAGDLFRSFSKKNNNGEILLSATQENGVIPRDMLEGRVTMPEGSTNSYKLVVPGDFIISLRSFQGGLEYSKYRGIVSPAYTVLKPKMKIDDSFYKHYFKSYIFIGHLAVAVIGIRDGKQISYGDFAFLKLPYPIIEEQQKIAAVLNAADREIELLEKRLEALNKQKKGLMQKLLTGRVRLTTITN